MAWIEKQQLNSSNLEWVAYLEPVLIVKFNSGAIYLYPQFPEWQYQDLLTPPYRGMTTGQYFSTQIKPHYKGMRLL